MRGPFALLNHLMRFAAIAFLVVGVNRSIWNRHNFPAAHLARRIARAAVRFLVEGQKPRLPSRQLGGHRDEVIIYCKVGQTALEAEWWLLGITRVLVLLDRVGNVLAGDLVL